MNLPQRLSLAYLVLAPFARLAPQAPNGQAADALPFVERVDLQPLRAQVRRLFEALDYLGEPLVDAEARAAALAALESGDAGRGLADVQRLLDAHCLAGVHVNPESRVEAQRGPAAPLLVEQGWRTFLVKVHNEAGVTARLAATSPSAAPVFALRDGAEVRPAISSADVEERWMELATMDRQPLTPALSGLSLEYRILQVYSRDAGKREATLSFDVGQGTQDIGFRNDLPILFDATPSARLTLRVRDFDGEPTTAGFTIRDRLGREYPSRAKRLAPDFAFHPQVYRADGESVTLPAGEYRVEATRGPEYRVTARTITIDAERADPVETFELERWIHPAKLGWFSGDHHVHAAGCAHYSDPTQGVEPADMLRHVQGEGLDVGCVLSWGPCWYYQKEFFDGGVHELSTKDNVLRYDVEVSGFPSDYAGHLCLLGLTEDDYPGTQRIEDWPGWDLPILLWARAQGAVVGFAHSGWGLETQSMDVPNGEIPPFDGIGANEYIVDVTHDAVDFISAVDTPWPFELNIWYHTNDAGFRTKLSGETDFPCIYGDRVGLGRSYVKAGEALGWDGWLAGVAAGRSYVSEGRTHLFDFQVGGRAVGTGASELRLAAPGEVRGSVTVAALLDERPNDELRARPLGAKPYWHVERARLFDTRRVALEIVVNGLVAAREEIVADGTPHPVSFELEIERSSWVAARIFAAAHTNPVYVVVGGEPIRASRESLQWCLDSVERCWESKSGVWRQRFGGDEGRKGELEDCRAAYEHARRVYRERLEECE